MLFQKSDGSKIYYEIHGQDTGKKPILLLHHGIGCVNTWKEIYPDMEVLVLGVLPRRRNLDHPHRKQINELNSYLPELLKDMKGVKFLDIGPVFLDEKGFLPKEMMPDTTHPSEKGHEVWAEAISSELKKILSQ